MIFNLGFAKVCSPAIIETYSRTSIIRPSIIRIFNYPTSNPLSQLHLNLLFGAFYYPTFLLSDLIVTLPRGSDNRGSTVFLFMTETYGLLQLIIYLYLIVLFLLVAILPINICYIFIIYRHFQKLFSQAVGYGHLRCYFFHVFLLQIEPILCCEVVYVMHCKENRLPYSSA